MLNKYEFRQWSTYEEWFEVIAKDEKEAWDKFHELGREDITTSKWIGNEGDTELYRTTQISDDEEEVGGHVEDNGDFDEPVETKSNAVQDSGFMGQMD